MTSVACKIAPFLALLLVCVSGSVPPPEQLHLSLGNVANSAVAMWVVEVHVTAAPAGYCTYGTQNNSYSAAVDATFWTYTAGGFNATIYQATMTQLTANTRYYYRCGSSGGSTSAEFSFVTPPPAGDENPVAMLVLADMGLSNPALGFSHDATHTQQHITQDVLTDMYHLILDVGDSGYADDYPVPNSHAFDSYFRQIEPFAARVPYMMCPGNHEAQFNFSGYLNRTLMPVMTDGPLRRFYYSLNYGPVHLVSFSTEHPVGNGTEQNAWLAADLAAVNRSATPWVVAFSHHPLYCTDNIQEGLRCGMQAAQFREDLEELFYTNHVDLYLAGHDHSYERSYSVYNNKVLSKSYVSPPATIYVVNGNAGNREGTDTSWIPDVPTRAFYFDSADTGYGRVTVNRTALTWTQVDSTTGKVIDEFVVKEDSER